MHVRLAFIGFRHGHILSLHELAQRRDDVEVIAACEEDAETRAGLADAGVTVTHDDYGRMLDEAACDVVACGDYFGIRGQRLIQALERGLHVIGDKPLCTSLEELERIEALAAAGDRRVGCMLDLGNHRALVTLGEMLGRDAVGEVHAVCFLGQHPLLYGQRPMWYFEPGKHGGTINDIAIHAVDVIPAVTGRRIVEVTAARSWNAKVSKHPHFHDGGALMLRLDNDGVVIGDVSYLASDKHGYGMAPYWRFTISGADGVIETSCNAEHVTLWRHDAEEVVQQPVGEGRHGGYFEDFLADLAGAPKGGGLQTGRVLESSRISLRAQHAADRGEFPVSV